MAEGLIMGVLRENNIELSENTFRFHLKVLLEKHGGLFESMIARIGRENVLENLCVIYQELEPSNFGRIMARVDSVLYSRRIYAIAFTMTRQGRLLIFFFATVCAKRKWRQKM
jgi:hypothetical protein